ncbi:MAG: DUF4393 domain-containing protein [Mesorhizobium sp.]|nr:Abi-alpha family protein [Mesorhizobium sp.]MBL8576360.1 DUF4393 domain-containing protein [Mesorhizobium sp.]
MILSDEESKAVQEVAKTATAYQKSVDTFGKFVANVLGHPLKQGMGLVGDGFGMLRIELAMRFQQRVERLQRERGLSDSHRPVPLSIAYPLLEAASLEEDETLSDMFAQLLVNAMDHKYGKYIPKSYIETVRLMSPLEALILKTMVEAPQSVMKKSGMMYTLGLPSSYADLGNVDMSSVPPPEGDTAIALAALDAAGCIEPMMLMSGGYSYIQAKVSEYGRELILATRPN